MSEIQVDIVLVKVDNVYMKVHCSPDIAKELQDFLTFRIDKFWFQPAYKSGNWDGYVRLLDLRNKHTLIGLRHKIKQWAIANGYELVEDGKLKLEQEIPESEFRKLFETISLKEHFKLEGKYYYQYLAIKTAIERSRCIIESPTGSGKSIIIYGILSILLNAAPKRKALVIVPTINLVSQLKSDFCKYSKDPDFIKNIHEIYSGKDKNSDCQIIISTWQSIFRLSPEWFEQFDIVVGDEVHEFAAASCKKLMQKTSKAIYKFGTTGTMADTIPDIFLLEGLFGSVYTTATTKELMDEGVLSQLKIKCLVIKYPEELCKLMKKVEYTEEIKYLLGLERRNNFIVKIASKLPKNTLVLFQFIEHGKLLYEELKKIKDDVYYISGETDVDIREEIRLIVNDHPNATILASAGTFSKGIDINNLHNILFTTPSKARKKILQQIGRGLRLSDDGSVTNLIDIVDDMSYRRHKNYALEHFLKRIDYYDQQKFSYSLTNINIE